MKKSAKGNPFKLTHICQVGLILLSSYILMYLCTYIENLDLVQTIKNVNFFLFYKTTLSTVDFYCILSSVQAGYCTGHLSSISALRAKGTQSPCTSMVHFYFLYKVFLTLI
jgi:hypothetical protein